MFNKPDRYIVEMTVEFNIYAIGKWLEAGGEIVDAEKIERNWAGGVNQVYKIDIVPCGAKTDFYFHRKAGAISNNIGGIDFLEKADSEVKRFAEKYKISVIEWKVWREYLGLNVNNKPILLVPLREIVELQLNRTLKSGGTLRQNDTEIEVPIAYDDEGKPKSFIKVLRGSNSSKSVGYSNALGSVSASTLNFEVEY